MSAPPASFKPPSHFLNKIKELGDDCILVKYPSVKQQTEENLAHYPKIEIDGDIIKTYAKDAKLTRSITPNSDEGCIEEQSKRKSKSGEVYDLRQKRQSSTAPIAINKFTYLSDVKKTSEYVELIEHLDTYFEEKVYTPSVELGAPIEKAIKSANKKKSPSENDIRDVKKEISKMVMEAAIKFNDKNQRIFISINAWKEFINKYKLEPEATAHISLNRAADWATAIYTPTRGFSEERGPNPCTSPKLYFKTDGEPKFQYVKIKKTKSGQKKKVPFVDENGKPPNPDNIHKLIPWGSTINLFATVSVSVNGKNTSIAQTGAMIIVEEPVYEKQDLSAMAFDALGMDVLQMGDEPDDEDDEPDGFEPPEEKIVEEQVVVGEGEDGEPDGQED